MNFLNPIYLFALAAVAIPILIHIFSRRRVPQVPFSTIRFLNRSDRRSMVRINLRRLILLALRILGIALVALVFARPVVRGALATLFPRGGSRAACILIDRSYSMRVEGEEGTLFDRAKARAASVLESLDKGDRVSIILFDAARETVYDGELEPEVALGAIRRLEPSWSGTDLASAVALGRRTLEASRRDVRELYIISDFQRTGLGARSDGARSTGGRPDSARSESARSRLPVRAFLMPVRSSAASNVAITGALTPRAAVHKGETVRLSVQLRNTSRELEARFPLTVSLGGRSILEKEINMPPESAAEETVTFPIEQSGWVEGIVTKSPDRLGADDTRFFALRARDKANVLLVAGERGFYLEQALSPGGAEGDISVARTTWPRFTSRALEGAEAVVLGPGGAPEAGDIELIERFVSVGGRAIVLVVPELEGAVTKLSRLSPRIEFVEMQEGFVAIERPASAPAFLAPFDASDLDALARIKFRKVALARNVPERAVRLKFRGGTPFVWEEERGEGTIIFAALDPSPEAGELVLSPFFLPLVQQLVLAGGTRAAAAEGRLVGEPIVWPAGPGEEFVCRLPGGAEIKPERVNPRGAGGEGGARGGAVIVPPVEEPGFVRILGGGEVRGAVAVNVDCRKESDLDALSPREAADSLGLRFSTVVDEAHALAPAVRSAREGREISTALLLLAIAVFVAEAVIAQRETGEAA